MNFIQQAKAKGATNASLKLRMHQHLAHMAPARSPFIMHASEATKPEFCPRMQAIRVAAGLKPPEEFIQTSLAYTFEKGKLLQDWLVNQFADMGIAIGHWKCRLCSRLYEFCKRPSQCSNCGGNVWQPIEVRFTSPISGISGGFDMIADLGLSKLRLIEVKTMNPEDFKKLAAPLAEHKVRTALYLRLAAESRHPLSEHVDNQVAHVFYMSMGYGVADTSLKDLGVRGDGFSPFKEFLVQRDDSITESAVTRAKTFVDWLKGAGGMPERVCSLQTDIRAQKCAARVYCFGQAFPPGVLNSDPVILKS